MFDLGWSYTCSMEIGVAPDGVEEMVDAIDAAEVVLRAAQAARLAAVWELIRAAGARDSTVADASVAAEIACALHVSTRSAGYLMDRATAVCSRPAVFDALAGARIDLARATVITDLLDTGDLAAKWEAAALAYAASHTPHAGRCHVSSSQAPTTAGTDAAPDRYWSSTARSTGM